MEDQAAGFGDVAFEYGKHLGIAFQLVDDLLDFEGTLDTLGKPAMNDLKQVGCIERERHERAWNHTLSKSAAGWTKPGQRS